MASLGERLRALREGRNLTQIDLAKMLSLANSTISQYEANRRTPDPSTLQRLADYFSVSVDYLLGRTDDPRPPKERTNPLTSDEAQAKTLLEHTHPEMVDLLYRVKDLTEEEKQSLLEHWEWAMKVIEEERERRKKFKEKFKDKE